MKIWYVKHGWETDDIFWFLRNWKNIYHLKCMWMDGHD